MTRARVAIVLLAVLAAAAAPARATDFKTPLLVYGGTALGDLGTTEIALHAGQAEGHPFLQDRGTRFAVKAGMAVALLKADTWAQRRISKGHLWIFRGLWIAGHVVVCTHNLSIARHPAPASGR